jgi:hypothetical protein
MRFSAVWAVNRRRAPPPVSASTSPAPNPGALNDRLAAEGHLFVLR